VTTHPVVQDDVQPRALDEAAAIEPAAFFEWVRTVHPIANNPRGDCARVARYCREHGRSETEARAFELYRQVHAMLTAPPVWQVVEDVAVHLTTVGSGRLTPRYLKLFRAAALEADQLADQFGPLAGV
jgi:hypothetical protein